MASYDRREVTTTRVEFRVPVYANQGSSWVAVMQAVQVAHNELRAAKRVPKDRDAPDDLIRVIPADDAVIVAYDHHETEINVSAEPVCDCQ